MTTSRGRIGITCRSHHPVFSVVADRLASRGFDVAFLDPEHRIAVEDVSDLSLLVAKSTRPATVRALMDAERHGVPTWNSATGVMVCASRLCVLCALEHVGFRVPAVYPTRPETGEYVAKSHYHWGDPPNLNGNGDIYEELLPIDPIDYKYYVVHDGVEYRTVTVRATSKLFGSKHVVGTTEPVQEHVDGIQRLMARLGMRAIGVDFVSVDEDYYAVDVNPCPSFKQTGLETALVDSIVSSIQ